MYQRGSVSHRYLLWAVVGMLVYMIFRTLVVVVGSVVLCSVDVVYGRVLRWYGRRCSS